MRFFHLWTSIPNGLTLHVKHAPVAGVTGDALDDAAAKHGVPQRLPDETDGALQARIHASAPRETVEVRSGTPTKVSAAFWERWLHLNPGSPLLADGKINAAEVEEPDAEAVAVDERRASVAVASGPALDHLAALHGVEPRAPGEPDGPLRARLTAAADAAATKPDPDVAEQRKAFEEEVAQASTTNLDILAEKQGIGSRLPDETDEALRLRVLATNPPPLPVETI